MKKLKLIFAAIAAAAFYPSLHGAVVASGGITTAAGGGTNKLFFDTDAIGLDAPAQASGLALSAGATPQAITLYQWTVASGGNGHYYGITNSTTDWNSAEQLAVSVGGTLATITSAAEQTFINNTFLASGAYSNLPLWIGLNDTANGVGSKNYTNWVTGEAVTYTNWNAGEPSNTSPGEDYVTINWHFARGDATPMGTWNDTPEAGSTGFGGNTDGPYYGIVEIVPEPSAWAAVLTGCGALAFVIRRRAGSR